MAYQIVKGWPAEGAIDEVITPATDVILAPGTIAKLDVDGNGVVATYAALGGDAADKAAFIFDEDPVRGKVMGLFGNFMLEVDAEHYAADTYAANDVLTAIDGVFAKPTDQEPVLGQVRSFDATSGKMRIIWTG